jgi:hypothetical protein
MRNLKHVDFHLNPPPEFSFFMLIVIPSIIT